MSRATRGTVTAVELLPRFVRLTVRWDIGATTLIRAESGAIRTGDRVRAQDGYAVRVSE